MTILLLNTKEYVKYVWKDIPEQFIEPMAYVLRPSLQVKIKTLHDLTNYHEAIPTICFILNSGNILESFHGLQIQETCVGRYSHYVILETTDDKIKNMGLEWN